MPKKMLVATGYSGKTTITIIITHINAYKMPTNAEAHKIKGNTRIVNSKYIYYPFCIILLKLY